MAAQAYLIGEGRWVAPEPTTAPASPVTTATSRDMTITRLATLNTATSILSSGGPAADPDDVLTLAAVLEAWAVR